MVERATELEEMAHRVVQEYKNQSKTHLLSALEHEVAVLSKLASELKSFSNSSSNTTTRTHEINQLEERLLHHENRVNEEIDFINAVFAVNETTKSTNELIAYGKKLVKDAVLILNLHQHHTHEEVHALKNEVHEVEKLMGKLERDLSHHHGNDPHHHILQDEVALMRHEFTMRLLIERIEHSHKHHF